MKPVSIIILLLCVSFPPKAQKYITSTGSIELYGETPFENIKADNNQVESSLNPNTGEIEFHALMKSFHFKKQAMEDAFNKDIVESDKYPQSTFKGRIMNFGAIHLNKDGNYPVTVTGNLFMHNVTRTVSHPGMLIVVYGHLSARSDFKIKPEDFNITVPTFFGKKLVNEINVKINMSYTSM